MVIRRVAAAARGCVGPVETRNEARVHLWFESRFGSPYPRLSSADAALRHASVVHAVGVRLEDDDRLDVAAPFGLDDVFAMVIRPNRALHNAVSHGAKARRAQAIWPEGTVISWESEAPSLCRDDGLPRPDCDGRPKRIFHAETHPEKGDPL